MNRLAYRNTEIEEQKIAGAQRRCPKIKISVDKPDKYTVSGIAHDGEARIVVSAWGITAALRLFEAEYFRLDKAGMLPVPAKKAGA